MEGLSGYRHLQDKGWANLGRDEALLLITYLFVEQQAFITTYFPQSQLYRVELTEHHETAEDRARREE